MLRDVAAFLAFVTRYTAAIPAAVLPRRHWRRLDAHLPLTRAALASALATVAFAGVIGVPAFFHELQARTDRAVETMLESTGWRVPARNRPAPSGQRAAATWLTSYLAFFSFAILTPVGLLSTYLGVTGVVRAVSAVVDQPLGDPLLTAIDAAAVRASSQRASRQARIARERLEGPEVPDRLLPGRAGGFPDADFVVVASRRKPDWTPGAFVITSDKWYRLGTAVERQTPGGLRTLYPLTELRDHEVLRRGIPYELPALTGSVSKTE